MKTDLFRLHATLAQTVANIDAYDDKVMPALQHMYTLLCNNNYNEPGVCLNEIYDATYAVEDAMAEADPYFGVAINEETMAEIGYQVFGAKCGDTCYIKLLILQAIIQRAHALTYHTDFA